MALDDAFLANLLQAATNPSAATDGGAVQQPPSPYALTLPQQPVAPVAPKAMTRKAALTQTIPHGAGLARGPQESEGAYLQRVSDRILANGGTPKDFVNYLEESGYK